MRQNYFSVWICLEAQGSRLETIDPDRLLRGLAAAEDKEAGQVQLLHERTTRMSGAGNVNFPASTAALRRSAGACARAPKCHWRPATSAAPSTWARWRRFLTKTVTSQ